MRLRVFNHLKRFAPASAGVPPLRVGLLNQVNEDFLLVEEERTVLADNTFSLKSVRFEAPRDLRSRKIQVRFDRKHFGRAVVYYKNERMGDAHPVDFLVNDRMPTAAKEAQS